MNITQLEVNKEAAGYIFICAFASMGLIVMWAWLGYLRWKEHRTWHTWGCILYGISYLPIMYVNVRIGQNDVLGFNLSWLVWIGFMTQFAATLSFLINSLTKDHVRQDDTPTNHNSPG